MKKDSKEEDRPLSDNEAEHKEESDNYNIPKSPEYGHFKRIDTVEIESQEDISTNVRTEEVKKLIIPQIFHESLKSFDLEMLLNPFSSICDDIYEVKSSKLWNKAIEDLKVLNIIEEQSYVIRETHKPLGRQAALDLRFLLSAKFHES